ncbi:winged helix-turn-helix domain-containing protein [Helicobacter bilis]|uniref:Phosphate regulon transcriptional regulatory protein PhoB n=1 Tax=Helicobacter bilis TaxID=37372 RepID=A0A4U8U6I5_9HELI|nr:response regulator transcription factor [Helicobacter bilis]MCI7411492.1 response regulator transcription factor [Helicobacter bilis]MDD7296547.1 response regulator transcription factor [Helicobacter bilis]MDY4400373.1 response regulator transcription factor [Helicobacter bilis]TLE08695.1 response regulator transcription factor [Helicobacter bilis]TLE08923.1 response regulator transcription factor [Helicobacter bilis]
MIFILEDEHAIRELIEYALNTHSLESKGFATPRAFFETLNALSEDCMPELILLDMMLPEQDGIEVLKILKKKQSTKHIPVILLTAKSSELDKVYGLNMGADDYVTKPFGVLELLARINALLRRTRGLSLDEYSFQEITLNPKTRIVSSNGVPINLTHKEFEMLMLFLANPHLVFTREQLLESIWGSEFQTRTVDVHINTLRTKLGESGKYIQTVRGVGYKIAQI